MTLDDFVRLLFRGTLQLVQSALDILAGYCDFSEHPLQLPLSGISSSAQLRDLCIPGGHVERELPHQIDSASAFHETFDVAVVRQMQSTRHVHGRDRIIEKRSTSGILR
jgi:hypothetical protein